MCLAIEKIGEERENKGVVVGVVNMCKMSLFPKEVAIQSIKGMSTMSIDEISKLVDKYWED